MKSRLVIMIDEEYCKGCLLCIHYCPKKVLDKSTRRNTKGYVVPRVERLGDCSQCKLCEYFCPELAVTVEGDK